MCINYVKCSKEKYESLQFGVVLKIICDYNCTHKKLGDLQIWCHISCSEAELLCK